MKKRARNLCIKFLKSRMAAQAKPAFAEASPTAVSSPGSGLLCSFYKRSASSCYHGALCRHIHISNSQPFKKYPELWSHVAEPPARKSDSTTVTPVETQDVSAIAIPPIEFCVDYFKGRCKFGSDCSFVHVKRNAYTRPVIDWMTGNSLLSSKSPHSRPALALSPTNSLSTISEQSRSPKSPTFSLLTSPAISPRSAATLTPMSAATLTPISSAASEIYSASPPSQPASISQPMPKRTLSGLRGSAPEFMPRAQNQSNLSPTERAHAVGFPFDYTFRVLDEAQKSADTKPACDCAQCAQYAAAVGINRIDSYASASFQSSQKARLVPTQTQVYSRTQQSVYSPAEAAREVYSKTQPFSHAQQPVSYPRPYQANGIAVDIRTPPARSIPPVPSASPPLPPPPIPLSMGAQYYPARQDAIPHSHSTLPANQSYPRMHATRVENLVALPSSQFHGMSSRFSQTIYSRPPRQPRPIYQQPAPSQQYYKSIPPPSYPEKKAAMLMMGGHSATEQSYPQPSHSQPPYVQQNVNSNYAPSLNRPPYNPPVSFTASRGQDHKTGYSPIFIPSSRPGSANEPLSPSPSIGYPPREFTRPSYYVSFAQGPPVISSPQPEHLEEPTNFVRQTGAADENSVPDYANGGQDYANGDPADLNGSDPTFASDAFGPVDANDRNTNSLGFENSDGGGVDRSNKNGGCNPPDVRFHFSSASTVTFPPQPAPQRIEAQSSAGIGFTSADTMDHLHGLALAAVEVALGDQSAMPVNESAMPRDESAMPPQEPPSFFSATIDGENSNSVMPTENPQSSGYVSVIKKVVCAPLPIRLPYRRPPPPVSVSCEKEDPGSENSSDALFSLFRSQSQSPENLG